MSSKDKFVEKFFLIIVGAIATATVAVATFVGEKIPGYYKNVKYWWTGKTIAIIGATASGKNSMYSRLRKEQIPAEHIQTRGAETVTNFSIYWPLPDSKTVDFKCKNSINIGGEIDERDRYWLQSCEGADVIFYLVDTKKLRDDQASTLKRFHDDMCWLVKNFRNLKSSVRIHLLLNKIDVVLGSWPHTESAKNSMQKLLEIIIKEAEDSLAENIKKVTGITPISMSDEYLFNRHFNFALGLISELKRNEN